jgi:hypothetical protein
VVLDREDKTVNENASPPVVKWTTNIGTVDTIPLTLLDRLKILFGAKLAVSAVITTTQVEAAGKANMWFKVGDKGQIHELPDRRAVKEDVGSQGWGFA